MSYGPLITAAILVISLAAVSLGWHEIQHVRGSRLARIFDRRYEDNLAARGRLPRT